MRFLLIALVFNLLGTSLIWGQTHFAFAEPVQPPRKTQLIAHRGMATLAPENSIEAILALADDFIEWAEVDIRLTKDGRHILIHDATLNRTTDGKGPVVEQTLEMLQSLDAGSWFAGRFAQTRLPSLVEVLQKSKGRINLYLDCKQINPALLVREILDAGMEKQVIVYGSPEMLAVIQTKSMGKIARMTKFRPKTMHLDSFIADIQPAAVEIDADEVTQTLCHAFHQKGIRVQAKVFGPEWDKPLYWEKMIQCGVDWLQTDDPLGARFTEVRLRIPKFPVGYALHRGAGRHAPENTLAAIQMGVQIGAPFIEVDIRTTEDNRFVLLHDTTINRTTNQKGQIKQMSHDAILKLDAGIRFGKPFAGTKIPTLDEGLKALGKQSSAYLDAKAIQPEALLLAINKHDIWERHVVYQSAAYCRQLKALDSRIRLLPPLSSRNGLKELVTLKPFGVDAKWSILSKELVDACHAEGIRVFSDALGLNETIVEYQKAIQMGVDVIQTDHPLRLLRAMDLLDLSTKEPTSQKR